MFPPRRICDICVLSERPISRSEVILTAKVIGGLQVIDQEEADDKIIAVLENDNVWGGASDLGEVPEILIERLRHYFATYKMKPNESSGISIEQVYGHEHALAVVQASLDDYQQMFGE